MYMKIECHLSTDRYNMLLIKIVNNMFRNQYIN